MRRSVEILLERTLAVLSHLDCFAPKQMICFQTSLHSYILKPLLYALLVMLCIVRHDHNSDKMSRGLARCSEEATFLVDIWAKMLDTVNSEAQMSLTSVFWCLLPGRIYQGHCWVGWVLTANSRVWMESRPRSKWLELGFKFHVRAWCIHIGLNNPSCFWPEITLGCLNP